MNRVAVIIRGNTIRSLRDLIGSRIMTVQLKREEKLPF